MKCGHTVRNLNLTNATVACCPKAIQGIYDDGVVMSSGDVWTSIDPDDEEHGYRYRDVRAPNDKELAAKLKFELELEKRVRSDCTYTLTQLQITC